MKFSIHPDLRWVLGRALLDATPALLVSALLAFWLYKSWTEDITVPAFGLAIMLLVAALRFGSHLWWLSRATQVLMTTQPVPMLLTADQGWRSVSLRPQARDGKVPAIKKIRFITPGSGMTRTALKQTLVEVYLDQATPDPIVMRYNGMLLCSEVKQRFEQGHSTPVRKIEKAPAEASPVAGDPSATAGAQINCPDNSQILEDISVLAQKGITAAVVVCMIFAGFTAFFVYGSGVWLVGFGWRLLLRSPMPIVLVLIPNVVLCVLLIYIMRYLYRESRKVLRGAWVVQHASPTLQRLSCTCQVRCGGRSNIETWFITV